MGRGDGRAESSRPTARGPGESGMDPHGARECRKDGWMDEGGKQQ